MERGKGTGERGSEERGKEVVLGSLSSRGLARGRLTTRGSDRDSPWPVGGTGEKTTPWRFCWEPPGTLFFFLFRSFSLIPFLFLFKSCSKTIIWGIKPTPIFIKFILLESSFNIATNYTICFDLWKGFVCILNKGNIMPINGYLAIQIFWALNYFRNVWDNQGCEAYSM